MNRVHVQDMKHKNEYKTSKFYVINFFFQEISLAQVAVLSIRNKLTTNDIFTATSQVNNLINKYTKVKDHVFRKLIT